MRIAQHRHQLGITSRAGAAAITLQQYALHAAVEQCAEMVRLQCRMQRQHGQVHPLSRLTVVDEGADPDMLGLTLTRQHLEGIELSLIHI